MDFSDLLNALSEIENLRRTRFTSPHPLHMDDKFLQTFSQNEEICKTMHMPLQSGSSEILETMKRGYSKEQYLDRALKFRELCRDVSISTDIIVTLPGESGKDFEDTLDVLKKVRFKQVSSFKYSKRPLTKAVTIQGRIPEDIASRRLSFSQNRHAEILDEIIKRQENQTFEVLFEELEASNAVAGRTDNNFLVQIQGSEEMLGTMKQVKITNTRRVVLYGEIA